ncbi:MAG: hypothetical protein ACYC1A_00055 [Spirochaetales bacterium]|jgi:predicted ferric reductase
MNKTMFYLAYFLSPLIPIIVYFLTLGIPFDLYALSVALGIAAFVFICNQFILASRPAWATKALGLKRLTRLHSTMPAVIVALAAIHESIKRLVGLNTESLQADFGAASLAVFIAVIVFTALFMVTTFWMKIDVLKKIRTWVYEKTGLDYKKARFLHNATIVAVPLLLSHVLLASSSRFSANPLGALILGGWMLLSLGSYIRYRINGRAVKAAAKA